MGMVDIYNYLDYRTYLRDAQEYMKSKDPAFTVRYVAAKVGYKSPGHITWILQGKRNLPSKQLPQFVRVYKLNKKEAQYFEVMVQYTNAKKHFDKKYHFEKLVSLQKTERRIVGKDELAYWDAWYHSAIRELVAIHTISDDYKKVAKMLIPRITPAEAEKSLKLLKRIGFIKKDPQGFYRRVDKVVSTGDGWQSLAIRQYQMHTMDLAKKGLESIPREKRDISSVTLSISEERFRQIQKRLREFRQEIITLARTDDKPERIYQLGLQIFPLSVSQRGDSHA
jgi:uncharacterized protein (TIGR02147 family)